VIQQILVVLIVLACAAWLGVQAYRFFSPKAGGKLCGGKRERRHRIYVGVWGKEMEGVEQ